MQLDLDWKNIAVPILLALLVYSEVSGFFDGRDRQREQEALAKLQTEKAVLVAERLGWKTAQAEGEKDLLDRIQGMKADSGSAAAEIKTLTAELAALNATLIAVTEVAATATGQISEHAVEHRSDISPEIAADPDSITANVDDGILSGRIAYFPAPRLFDLDYSAKISGTLVHSRTPDGRLLVAVRGNDERVTFAIPDLRYQLPEEPRGCGVFCVAGWVLKVGVPAYAAGRAGLP